MRGADLEDDWEDEDIWHKANPALGDFRNIEEMRELYRRAAEIPALQPVFQRLYLNMQVSLDVKYWPMAEFDICAGGNSFDNEDARLEWLKGRRCYAGLDLASTTDLNALSLVFPPDEPKDPESIYDVLLYYWIPEENMHLRSRRDKVPYELWHKEGHIFSTEGNVVDFGIIRDHLIKVGEDYDLQELAYDRWGATQLAQELEDEGIEVMPFGQGYASMNLPMKDLLKYILGHRLRHGGHPVLRWNAENFVAEIDPAENVKPNKEKSTERIDGMVATIMAFDRAVRNTKPKKSVYSTRGIRTL